MTKVIDKKKLHGAEFDLSSLFVDIHSAKRTIYIDNNDKVTCIDKLENHNVACKVRWNMCTNAKAKIIDDNTISLKQDDKEVVLRIVAPKSAKAYIMDNNSGNWYDVKNKGSRVGFSVNLAPSAKCALKVELVPQK
jgi:hypothetical protein